MKLTFVVLLSILPFSAWVSLAEQNEPEKSQAIINAAGHQELTLVVEREEKSIRVKVTPVMKPKVYRDVELDLEIIPLCNDAEIVLKIGPVSAKEK